MKLSVKKMCVLALMAALSFLVANTLQFSVFPSAPFLKYEPKDVVVTVGSFLYGPLSGLLISAVVSLPEMLVSGTGPIGGLMDILSTCSFACAAALVYKRRHTLGGAIGGLLLGSGLMVGVMLLWNWLVTPWYMGVERSIVEGMLLTVFLPFNLLKAGLNSGLVLCLYKPLVNALRRTGLVEQSREAHKGRIGLYLFAITLLVSCLLLVLAFQGVL